MSKTTERIVQVAAVLAILWFGWAFARETVLTLIRNNQQIQVLQQKLDQCNSPKEGG